MHYDIDRLILRPDDIDLSRSPLARDLYGKTTVLGAFNPGLTRLASGNLLMMVRIAEALREPIRDGHIHAIRWEASANGGRYRLDAWPVDLVDIADPRTFLIHGSPWKVMALTSLSWLLPVELSPDGLEIVRIHYDRAIAPGFDFQCYGIEDARISRVGERYVMTTCSVSPERHSTTLYTSNDGLEWSFADIVLDHQNKDMLIFEGLIDGQYWAQTRPLGDLYFAYPPGSEWRAGPSINLATSPDALHWKPRQKPGIRPRAGALAHSRIGGGAPPILTERGWLSLWHGVEPKDIVGIYRTFWSMLAADDPHTIVGGDDAPVLGPNAELCRTIEHQLYITDVVFTTGVADHGDVFVVASGEADLACRITHIPKSVFGLGSAIGPDG